MRLEKVISRRGAVLALVLCAATTAVARGQSTSIHAQAGMILPTRVGHSSATTTYNQSSAVLGMGVEHVVDTTANLGFRVSAEYIPAAGVRVRHNADAPLGQFDDQEVVARSSGGAVFGDLLWTPLRLSRTEIEVLAGGGYRAFSAEGGGLVCEGGLTCITAGGAQPSGGAAVAHVAVRIGLQRLIPGLGVQTGALFGQSGRGRGHPEIDISGDWALRVR